MSNSFQDRAKSQFTWAEILLSRGFRQGEVVQSSGGAPPCLQWTFVDGERIYEIWTEGEDQDCIVMGDALSEVGSASKFDVIRGLHVGGSWSRARDLVESGYSLYTGPLAELGRRLMREDSVAWGALTPEDRFIADAPFAASVWQKRTDLAATEEARRQLREARLAVEGPPCAPVSLDEFLEQEDSVPNFLIDGLFPWGGNVALVAAAKTGKTSLIYNLMAALADGSPFLGCFDHHYPRKPLGFLNFELTEAQAKSWFRRQPIENKDLIKVWNLRGKPNPFASRESMQRFAEESVAPTGISALIIDPFSGAFAGDSNNNDEVKQFLLMLDEFKELSGVEQLLIAVHAGNDVAKPRGATALQDHPDALWHLTKDAAGTRYFRAYGRDVEVEEGALSFDGATGLLTFVGGSRRVSRSSRIDELTLAAIRQNPGCTVGFLDDEIQGGKSEKSASRKRLAGEGRIRVVNGPGTSKLHYAAEAPVSREAPPGAREPRSGDGPPLFRGGPSPTTAGGCAGCGFGLGDRDWDIDFGDFACDVCGPPSSSDERWDSVPEVDWQAVLASIA